MTDLIAFLKARLDEDEAIARAATEGPWEWVTPEHSKWDDHGPHLMSKAATWTSPEGRGPYPVTVLGSWGYDAWGVDVEDRDAAHMARHDPARVLREVEAKRAILALHKTDIDPHDALYGSNARCEECGTFVMLTGPCKALRLLAAVYSDHEDYRPEWRPEGDHP